MIFATPVPNGRRAMLGNDAGSYFTGDWWTTCGGKFAVSVIRVTRDGQMEQFFNCFDNEQSAQSTARSHYETWKADANTASVRAEVRAASGELLYVGSTGGKSKLLIGLAVGGVALLATGGIFWFLTRKPRRSGLSGARRRRR